MSGDGFASPESSPQTNAATPPLTSMIQISRDKPCYYLTSVAHDRLPVFRLDLIKQIVCNAWCEARKSGEILIFAYVIMPDHSHIISDGHREISDVLRFTNGISAKRILDYLKENEFESSLRKLPRKKSGKVTNILFGSIILMRSELPAKTLSCKR